MLSQNKPHRRSVSTKLVLPFIAVFILAIVALEVVTIQNQKAALSASVEKRAETLARSLTEFSGDSATASVAKATPGHRSLGEGGQLRVMARSLTCASSFVHPSRPARNCFLRERHESALYCAVNTLSR